MMTAGAEIGAGMFGWRGGALATAAEEPVAAEDAQIELAGQGAAANLRADLLAALILGPVGAGMAAKAGAAVIVDVEFVGVGGGSACDEGEGAGEAGGAGEGLQG